jgi:hypothetical protein
MIERVSFDVPGLDAKLRDVEHGVATALRVVRERILVEGLQHCVQIEPDVWARSIGWTKDRSIVWAFELKGGHARVVSIIVCDENIRDSYTPKE